MRIHLHEHPTLCCRERKLASAYSKTAAKTKACFTWSYAYGVSGEVSDGIFAYFDKFSYAERHPPVNGFDVADFWQGRRDRRPLRSYSKYSSYT